MAKIASDIGKPDGLVVVPSDEVLSFLHPLPVSRLFGVGKVTALELAKKGFTVVLAARNAAKAEAARREIVAGSGNDDVSG